ncbi:HAD superfamily hydrolase, putative [Babesia caballi]|uniref:HAD superfamily hydrolase, putative n=1 Tax=Babesia caballi TaxID=5871 RepID=A0AAV4LYX9_BABCB|nr:HAD superfamily hydrolase, putative [Babesia caballi]
MATSERAEAPTSDSRQAVKPECRPPSPPPRFFGIDVDGTFHTLHEAAFLKNRKALRKLIEAAYRPFFCTGRRGWRRSDGRAGRPISAVQRIIGDLCEDGVYRGFPGIYQNGATVYNERGELISKVLFKKELVREICEVVERHKLGAHVVFESPEEYYVLAHDESTLEQLSSNMPFQNPINTGTNLGKAEVDPTPTVATTVEEICSADIAHILCFQFYKIEAHLKCERGVDYVAKDGPLELTDLNPPGVNKEAGLRVLMAEYGVDVAECCYIGDGSNDMEAMKAVDLSFAVGNAPESVKACAKYVVEETNDKSAFAKVVSLVYGIEVD